MRTDFSSQLQFEPGPLQVQKAVAEYLLASHPSGMRDGAYQRFVAELARGALPEAALQAARFAATLGAQPAASVQEGLENLQRHIARHPVQLPSGAHRRLDERVSVFNLSEHAVWLAERELCQAASSLSIPGPLTLVLDDEQKVGVKSGASNTVWTVGSQTQDGTEFWGSLAGEFLGSSEPESWPEWLQELAEGRSPVSLTPLPDELALNRAQVRAGLGEILAFYSHGIPHSAQAGELDEDAERVLTLLDESFLHYTQGPRLALSVRSLTDFSPSASWQRAGSDGLRAVLGMVCGDDTVLGSALAASPHLRVGTLVLTGDPDGVDDDLISATLPDAGCALILKPEVLSRSIALCGIPHPRASLPVPHARYGFYNTVGVGLQGALELLHTRFLLQVGPAISEHARQFFQGKSQEVGMSDMQHNPSFAAVMGGLLTLRQSEEMEAGMRTLREAVQSATRYALHHVLAANPEEDGIGVVHLGELTLHDIEQIVIPLEPAAFETYRRSRRYPAHLVGPAEFFASQGIVLRVRSPLIP